MVTVDIEQRRRAVADARRARAYREPLKRALRHDLEALSLQGRQQDVATAAEVMVLLAEVEALGLSHLGQR